MGYIYHDDYGWVFGKARLQLSASEQATYLLVCMDGKTPDKVLRQKFKNRFGVDLVRRDFEEFVHRLEEYHLLADRVRGCLISKLHIYFIKKQEKIFERERIRKPSYSGICYSNIPKRLEKDLRNCFASVDNRKLDALLRGIHGLRGILVPHSNLDLSGPCAAWAYKALTKVAIPDLFVILAPDHSCSISYPFSVLLKDFRTPLGLVKTDKDLIRMLTKECSFNIFADSLAHMKEHAIEIQLPFLQYIYKKNLQKLRIISMLCKKEPPSSELESTLFNAYRDQFLNALQKVIFKRGRNVVFVVTGDLMHIRGWKTTPQFHQKNKQIINLLKKANAEDVRMMLNSSRYTSCGRVSFYPFLRLLEPLRAKVLNYSWTSHSSSINKNRKKYQYLSLVNIGYVSMMFY